MYLAIVYTHLDTSGRVHMQMHVCIAEVTLCHKLFVSVYRRIGSAQDFLFATLDNPNTVHLVHIYRTADDYVCHYTCSF
jgi:hypothetical protein